MIPVLNGQPTLLAIDLFSGHRTEEAVDTFWVHDSSLSIIPRACTRLVQPLDISINRLFQELWRVSTQFIKEVRKENISDLITSIYRS